MRTAETKASNPVQTNRSQPFFNKDGQTAFFSAKQYTIQTQPFFTKQANPFIQPKLTIGQPNDKYEKEADAMADQVVQRLSKTEVVQTKTDSIANAVTPLVQTKCADCEQEEKLQKKEIEGELLDDKIQRKPIFESNAPPPEDEIQRKCAACGEEEKIQTKGEGSALTASAPSLENDLSSTKGSGSPLPDTTTEQMETSFGADFSQVRIHTGSNAVQMSQDLHAQAFTHGSDIYFNSGKYNPESTEGKQLLGHELTHTIQQGSSLIQPKVQNKPSGFGYSRAGAPNIQAAWYNFDIPGTDYQFDPSLSGLETAAGLAVETATDALEWIETTAGQAALAAANAMVGLFGGTVTIRGGCIVVEIEDVSLFDSFQKELGDDELPAIPILHIPLWAGEVGPVLLEAGLEVNVLPSILAAIGPGEIRNIHLEFCPFSSSTFEGRAQLYVAGAIGSRLSIFGGVVGRGLTVIPMDPPIPLEASLEGGVRGTATGWGIGAFQSDISLAYRSGNWIFDANNDINLGVLFTGDLDLYAAAKIFEILVCEYAYPLKHWEAGSAYNINIPVSLGREDTPVIGPITHGPMPIEEIETAIEPLSYGLNCKRLQETIEELCEEGYLPEEVCEKLREIIDEIDETGEELGEYFGVTPTSDIQCNELPGIYKYNSYRAAENELKRRLGIPSSTQLYRNKKRADRGPCPRVGWHYGVWDNSGRRGQPLGAIGECPCKTTDNRGNEINVSRFAVLNPYNEDFQDLLDYDYQEYLQDVSPDPLHLTAAATPTIHFKNADFPNIAPHIKNAQSTLGKPKKLNRLTDQSKIRGNRRAACRSFTGPGSCDEYPFASTYQGGAGAAIKGVPRSEQNKQGGFIGGFYRRFSLNDNDPFKVKAT